MKALYVLAIWLAASAAHADEALWAKLREGGYVVFIRHASTVPGTGDPPGFKLGDCGTQRNLSEQGRAESRRLGEEFRRRSIPVGEVRSSEWCRCVDTAKLAFGRVDNAWPALNSLFEDASREDEQRREVLAYAARVTPPKNLVLVTHNFNIRAFVGVAPMQAELVIAKSEGGRLVVVGRIPPP